jgi:hypothetical protein
MKIIKMEVKKHEKKNFFLAIKIDKNKTNVFKMKLSWSAIGRK